MENKKCEYGCNQEAKYQLKNGKWCCSKSQNSCLEIRKKCSEGLKRAYKLGIKKPIHRKKGIMNGWSKFSKEELKTIHKKCGETLSDNIKLGKTKPSFKNKKHTRKTKEKISIKMCGGNNGYIKTKYFEIFSPYQNKIVTVQGTWELKYAKWLNENNINWVRSRKINLKYKLFKDDYMHTYYPDFYLPDLNKYIEIKGFYWKSKDGKIDDKRKMQQVINHNKNKNIKILSKKELVNLNII